ncbi:MAG: TIGR04219 family outer membrane beta-barrel protein [Pseudomonadota bacterium]|nr:TIGR04219 family outer membrane beta-barrel protein [Pseudomonadota bacterium]
MRRAVTLALAGVAATALPVTSQADMILGVFAGAALWQQELSGEFSDSSTVIDVGDDLGIDDDSNATFYVALEHFVPLIPNIRVERNEIELSGSQVLTRTIDFGGNTYLATDRVQSDIDLGHFDFILYYELLDNWVSLDLGLDVKWFDGEIVLRSAASGEASEALESPVPMLYAKASLSLPFTGWTLAADLRGIGYSGDSFTDSKAFVAYEGGYGLGFELGYRRLELDVDDLDDVMVNLTVDGAYGAITYHF